MKITCSFRLPLLALAAWLSPVGPVRAEAGHHVVFDLADNRLLAHLHRGEALFVPLGSPGVAKYLHFGRPKVSWKLQEKRDGQAVALAEGHATLDLPLTAAQASAPAVHVRLHSAGPRALSLTVNGKKSATVDLVAGWQTVALTPAEGGLAAGENRVQLSFGRGGPAAVAWIQVGGEPPAETPPPFHDARSGELVLPAGTAAAWYVKAPEHGRLVADVGGAGCRVDVRAEGHGGASLAGALSGAGATLDLAPVAGRIVRLTMGNASCREARLARAGLALPGPAPQVRKPSKPRNVVFWIMDSLRADRVKPFWPQARPEVPEFERLATEGTIFRNSYVQGNESRASHASIWSALYPVNHQMIADKRKLDDTRHLTLGKAMREAGFYTSGVSSNGYVIGKWGFGAGWQAYRNHIHDGGGVKGENILDYGLRSLKGREQGPFFLYLGTVDTHVSWRAKEPWLSRYSPNYDGPFKTQATGHQVEDMIAGRIKLTEADKTHIRAIYDSNVSYQDKLVTDLREKLRAWGIDQDTMLVITADHGDEQWEDGRVGHGGSLKETLVRVPLLFHYPPLFPPGTVLEGAETVDVLPTLIDAVGGKVPEALQGESLIPLAQGVGRGYPRPSFASHYELAYTMRLADWKVRVSGRGVQLYAVEADPLEKQDLAESRPVERRFVTDSLSTFLIYQKHWRKQRWGVASNARPAFATDLEAGNREVVAH